MNLLIIFIYLQILDGLSTIIAFHAGAQEANLIVRELISHYGLAGLWMAKAFAISIGIVCYNFTRLRKILTFSNWLYGGVVLANLLGVLLQ